MTCPFCAWSQQQMERAFAEVLELRLQVADGPRGRVRELEGQLKRANETIAALNGRKIR